jgi:hypothetical protein
VIRRSYTPKHLAEKILTSRHRFLEIGALIRAEQVAKELAYRSGLWVVSSTSKQKRLEPTRRNPASALEDGAAKGQFLWPAARPPEVKLRGLALV